MAENENGLSDPLITNIPIKVKWPFKPPGAPGIPQCVEYTSNSITLKWTRPLNDDVNPIRGYIVEKKEKETNRWIP